MPLEIILPGMSLLYYLSRLNPPDNVEEPSKGSHLDPDLSPEPSIAEDMLVPTTMNDHSICIECGIMGDPQCEKTTFRSLCIDMNYSPVDEVCHAFIQANQVPF